MAFRKPEWLDTAVGIAGFLLSVISALALLSNKPYFSNEIAVIGALAFGLLIVLVAILFRPRHEFAKLSVSAARTTALKLLNNAEEVIVVNPYRSSELTEQLLPNAMEKNIPISVVADAAILHNIVSYVSEAEERKFFDTARISGASTEEFIICFVHNGRKKISVVFLAKKYAYLFSLTDSTLVSLVASILKRENQHIGGFIGLGAVASPRKIISVVHEEQQRYLRNFQTLQKGYISFYGTEVQSVQAGWVESGDFKSIDTLDITTRPDRLLQRQRYNAANKEFISNGGSIRRIYMARNSDLANKVFKKNLVELYTLQMDIGVKIGFVILDDLPQHYRKDFILYDDSIVLVEDQQASSDYTLGRSTAYFGEDELKQHRNDFDAMWSGKITGLKPTDYATQMLAK